MSNIQFWQTATTEEEVVRFIPEAIKLAHPDTNVHYSEPFHDFTVLRYPHDSPIQYAILAAHNHDAGNLELTSITPIAPFGAPTKVFIHSIDPNFEDGEAVITASLENEEGITFKFFDPLYCQSHQHYTIGAIQDIQLAGLIISSETGHEEVFEVTTGGIFEMHKSSYLEEHPDTPENEIPPAKVYADNLFSFIPTLDDDDTAEFITTITDPTQHKSFDGTEILSWDAKLLDNDEQPKLTIPLYLNPQFNQGPKPKDATRIRGRLWLQGKPLH